MSWPTVVYFGGGIAPEPVVGPDTRISGQFLESAVVAGLASAGVDVLLLGVLPTPGVAYLTGALGVDLGVMLPPRTTRCLTTASSSSPVVDTSSTTRSRSRSSAGCEKSGNGRPALAVGRVSPYADAVNDYAAHLVAATTMPLGGLKVVLDCAEGAAFESGPKALRDAGAEVIAIHAEPDGLNINDNCGSTHLESLQRAVIEHGADAGFGLDGDSDRCLAVDHEGNIVDGDEILAVLALRCATRACWSRTPSWRP